MKQVVLLFLLIQLSHAHPGFVGTHGWSSVFDSSSYQRGEVLNDNYLLFWTPSLATNEITFAAVVHQDVGWVGLGISANGGMKGADVAVLLKDESTGEFRVEDRFATGFFEPALDSVQNIALVKSETKQENGVTVFVFKRFLNSCDRAQDFDLEEGVPNFLIFAYGSSPVFGYHGATQRGGKQVWLLNEYTPSVLEQDVLTMEIRTPTVAIPAEDTTYICSFHNSLPTDRKYHVVKIEPLVTGDFVHHMILNLCETPENDTLGATVCNTMKDNCNTFWTGWAIGGKTSYLPLEAGLPMGAGNFSAKYLKLTIHYNNPQLSTSLVDTGSGFRITYTPTLRPNDMGVLQLGQTTLNIPPQTPVVDRPGICTPQCSSKFPTNGVTVYSVNYHMHYLGSNAYTQVIRSGVELPNLYNVPYYDNNFQNANLLKAGTKLLPGDTYVHHCVYNSVGRDTLTTWGESTSDEMCLAYVMYYPLMDITHCFGANITVGNRRVNSICKSRTNPLETYDYTLPAYTPLQNVPEVCSGNVKPTVEETEGDSAAHFLTFTFFFVSFLLKLVL